MRKGTIQEYTFETTLDAEQIKSARVIFAHGDKTILKKDTKELEIVGNTIICRLTQQETFLFECNTYCDIELRVLDVNCVPYKSDIFQDFVERCLDKEVLE